MAVVERPDRTDGRRYPTTRHVPDLGRGSPRGDARAALLRCLPDTVGRDRRQAHRV